MYTYNQKGKKRGKSTIFEMSNELHKPKLTLCVHNITSDTISSRCLGQISPQGNIFVPAGFQRQTECYGGLSSLKLCQSGLQ